MPEIQEALNLRTPSPSGQFCCRSGASTQYRDETPSLQISECQLDLNANATLDRL